MKVKLRNSLSAIIICVLTTGVQSCKENNLVFPEQIEVEVIEAPDRGPVKQNNLPVILDEDRTIKFDLRAVDTDKITALFFSYNQDGEKVDTKITDYESLYTIKNVSVDENTLIDVWAIDGEGKESKKYTYVVKALPYAVEKVLNSIKFGVQNLSAYLDVLNISTSEVTLYYKLDNAPSYTELVLPVSSVNKEVWFRKLNPGQHTISYYGKDAKGQAVDVKEYRFEIIQPPIIKYETKEQKAKWTIAVNANHSGDGDGGPGLIDGNVETFWHTPWSGTIPPWPFEATIGFNEGLVLTGVILNLRHNNGGGAPKEFELQTSEDGKTFTTVQKFTNTSSTAKTVVTFNLNSPLETRHVRLSFKNGFNATYMSLGEISFIGYNAD